jgi:hypothetical protein
MQTTESWERDDPTAIRRRTSLGWCLLRQAEVSSILVIVANIVREQSFQMAFVHRNNVVQQITAAAFDPTLCHAVLPRAFERDPDWPDLQGPNRSRNVCAILAIPIEDQEPGR